MYGTSEDFYKYGLRPECRAINRGDQVFIRLQLGGSGDYVFGVFTVVDDPPHGVHAVRQNGWWLVDRKRTPHLLLPAWIEKYPVCLFFDKELAGELKYVREERCTSLLGRSIPPMGSLAEGEKLYEVLLREGRSAEEFVGGSVEQIKMDPTMLPERTLKTKRGVLVRSKSEKMIDDWLYDHGIRAEYERAMNLSGQTVFPDWYLPDCDVVLEHLGLLKDEQYSRSWEKKRELYRANDVKVVTLDEMDVMDLDKALAKKLRPFFPQIR
jgi:hypothetical protein